jgi:hypothetical protein
MSIPYSRKLFASVAGVAVLATAFSFLAGLYRQEEEKKNRDAGNATERSASRSTNDKAVSEESIATPDTLADALVAEMSLGDDAAFEAEVGGERDAVTASVEELQSLSQSYDETQR